MRMIIGSSSEWVCKWVAHGLGEPGAFQNRAYGLAVIYRDEPVAGLVYHDWTDHNCFMSIYSVSPHWASKGIMRQIFGYPFNQMQVNRVSVIVRGGNRKWRKDLRDRYGFIPECKLEDWFGEGSHGYLLRMKRSECKWIEDGQRIVEQQRAAV